MIVNGKEIKINRENAVVSEIDEIYIELVRYIIEHGVRVPNRTGIDTIAVPGYTFQIDLSKWFPILETKLVNAKKLTSEIQWIHQEQSNRVDWLHERDNDTWDGWVVDEDGIYRVYEQGENAVDDPDREVQVFRKVKNPKTGKIELEPMFNEDGSPMMAKPWTKNDKNGKPLTIKQAIWFGPEYAGTIGVAYGAINAITHSPQCVEETLKTDPYDRRMQISLRQDDYLVKAVLPSCVWACEFTVIGDVSKGEGVLHSVVHQRSADVPVGLPFNVPQYAVLHYMYAKTNNLKPGIMTWVITNAHIYVNQLEDIKKQIKRYDYMKEYSKFIQENDDGMIELRYGQELKNYMTLSREVGKKFGYEILDKKMKDRLEIIRKEDEYLASLYEEAYERNICFEHMLTRENPELELAEHDSIFDYSTEYAKKGDPYLKENPIGNKELVLKKYHPTPFIKYEIAQ